MVKISVTKYSYVLDDERIRLDSKFYRKEFVETIEILNAVERNGIEVKPLGSKDISITITDGKHGYYTFVDNGVPFIRNKNVKTVFLDLEDVKYISPKEHKENIRSEIVHEDILLTSIGTVGNAGIFLQDKFEKANISQNLVKIRVNRKNINPYYLVIFLNSKYGRFQTLRFVQGNNQPYINFPSIKKILVPLLSHDFQLHIEQLVKQAYEKRKLAEQKYQQAEELLYELLGISKEEIEKLEVEKAYEVNFKEVKQAFRFDAEYYHPKYIGVIRLLKKTPFKLKPLKEVARIKHKKVNPEEKLYRTKKVKYIEIGGIDTAFGEIIEYMEEYGWKLPSGGKYLVKEKDILYSKVRPYRKGIGFVTEEFEGSLVTQGFTVVRCVDKSVLPEYLFLYLRSDIGNLPLLRNMSGSTYPTVRDEDIGEILVPILPRDEQEEIANLVKECFNLRKEAKQLIQRAIREVEEEIENASRSNGE